MFLQLPGLGLYPRKTANNALHRTAIPLRSIAAGELSRYIFTKCSDLIKSKQFNRGEANERDEIRL